MNAQDAQRLRALSKAQFVRSQRAEMKRGFKDGSLDPFRLLAGSDEWEPIVAEMRVDRFLLAIPGLGDVTLQDALAEFSLRGDWLLGALTYARRAELAEKLKLALSGEPMPPAQRPAA
jgi:hypothetical protein